MWTSELYRHTEPLFVSMRTDVKSALTQWPGQLISLSQRTPTVRVCVKTPAQTVSNRAATRRSGLELFSHSLVREAFC